MEYTKGDWIVVKNMVGAYSIVTEDTHIANVSRHFNAQLIAAAINACIKVNPDNPLAVADSIADMYEALKNLVDRHDGGLALGEKMDLAPARKAIAKAEGK